MRWYLYKVLILALTTRMAFHLFWLWRWLAPDEYQLHHAHKWTITWVCIWAIVYIIIALILFLLIRGTYCIMNPTPPIDRSKSKSQSSNSPTLGAVKKQSTGHTVSTMIVLGSGGHTSEMITLTSNLDRHVYQPIYYVASKTDTQSLSRVQEVERKNAYRENDGNSSNLLEQIQLFTIYRAREVHQSYITSIFSTFQAFIDSVSKVWKLKPDLIIANGPGTCVPIMIAGFLMRVFWIKTNVKLIFVESFCRVDNLSLSGKILYRFVNRFVVPWPQLQQKYPKAEYIGQIF